MIYRIHHQLLQIIRKIPLQCLDLEDERNFGEEEEVQQSMALQARLEVNIIKVNQGHIVILNVLLLLGDIISLILIPIRLQHQM